MFFSKKKFGQIVNRTQDLPIISLTAKPLGHREFTDSVYFVSIRLQALGIRPFSMRSATVPHFRFRYVYF